MTLDELSSQILVVPFIELEPHIKRGAVIVLDDELDMAQTGLLIVEDDQVAVSGLIDRRLLTKASGVEFEAWRRDKRFFRILIVQPFVLAQNFTALAEPKPN